MSSTQLLSACTSFCPRYFCLKFAFTPRRGLKGRTPSTAKRTIPINTTHVSYSVSSLRLNTLLSAIYQQGIKHRYYPSDISCRWCTTYPSGLAENFPGTPLNVPRRRSREGFNCDRLLPKMLRLRWAKRRL